MSDEVSRGKRSRWRRFLAGKCCESGRRSGFGYVESVVRSGLRRPPGSWRQHRSRSRRANEMNETVIAEGIGRVDVSFSERGAGQQVLSASRRWRAGLGDRLGGPVGGQDNGARRHADASRACRNAANTDALTSVGGPGAGVRSPHRQAGCSTGPPSWATRSEAGSRRSWACWPGRASAAWCSSTPSASKCPTIPPRMSSAGRPQRPTARVLRCTRAR